MTASLSPGFHVLTGNHAVSHGARLARVEVIAAYPITPQTQVSELLSQFCEDGSLPARFIKVESEHSAMAALVGASSAGARAFTATSSQGLALMHEMLHWAAGARLPIVLANINRALGAPWSVWTDQNDSLSQRDTGWLQIYCEDSQEVLDTVLQAFRISETVRLPVMLILDAFFLSHTAEGIEIPDQELVDSYLDPVSPQARLDTDNPHALSGLATPDQYMEYRYAMQLAMERALTVAEEADQEFASIFGRRYGIVEPYRVENAELLLITSSTVTSTAREVVDQLRREGHSVGLLKIRVFRPFPCEQVRCWAAQVSKIAVIDRNIGFGVGGIFAQEVRAALHNHVQVPVYGFVAGLGGRDITPDTIREIVRRAEEGPAVDNTWIGVKE
jgi:pyruvate ferredoxin oxidoreductase alpha subunit